MELRGSKDQYVWNLILHRIVGRSLILSQNFFFEICYFLGWFYVFLLLHTPCNCTSICSSLLLGCQKSPQIHPPPFFDNTPVSSQTVYRRLCKRGVHKWKPAQAPILTTEHQQQRLSFSPYHVQWQEGDWRRVFFIYESRFSATRPDGCIWRCFSQHMHNVMLFRGPISLLVPLWSGVAFYIIWREIFIFFTTLALWVLWCM